MTFDVCAWWTARTGQTMSGKKSEFAQWLRELEETIRKQHSGCGEADQRTIASMQAKIDRLMLEYCPEDMTPEQIENWKRHQATATQEQEAVMRQSA